MCTLVLKLVPGEVLAVSGNRNELLARPASGPAVHEGMLAPRDGLKGGTWLGLNRHGLFVCVTNRRGAPLDPSKKSRGLLVIEALQARSARELHSKDLRAHEYNGFHLVYADLHDAFVATQFQQQRLEPGRAHVITERSFGAGEGEREASVLREFDDRPLTLAAFREPMTRHAAEPLESACVHAGIYGTRSSLQLLLAPGGAQALWTDGHPCTNPARDLSELISQLGIDTSR